MFKRFIFISIVGSMSLMGCAKSTDSKTSAFAVPSLRVSVADVAGNGMTQSFTTMAVSQNNFQARFFGPGPTNVLNILSDIDSRLAGLASRDGSSCLANAPTAFAINVFGETMTLQLQCYDTVGGTGLITWGKKDDTWYIFQKLGAGAIAASAELLANGKIQTIVYGSVGIGNGTNWSSGSYGGYHIKSNNLTNKLEMAVAGIGFGFCGAYMNSDGTNTYIHGSEDDVGQACQTTANVCVLNANRASTGICTSLVPASFTLPPLGRSATTNYGGQTVHPSAYSPSLTFNGASNDPVHFGPSAPTDLPAAVIAY